MYNCSSSGSGDVLYEWEETGEFHIETDTFRPNVQQVYCTVYTVHIFSVHTCENKVCQCFYRSGVVCTMNG